MTLKEPLAKTDAELVQAFKSGQEEAFTQLVHRYRVRAIQMALIVVGNFEDAKDVSQEAFIKVHKALGKFEMKSQFSTWFYRILMNTAKDFMRKKKWEVFLSWKKSEDMQNYFDSIKGPSRSPASAALDSELRLKMTETIKKLPFQQSWIFTLRYLNGFSILQIAEVTELSEGTVKSTLHFAAQKFKKEIFPYLEKEKPDDVRQ